MTTDMNGQQDNILLPTNSAYRDYRDRYNLIEKCLIRYLMIRDGENWTNLITTTLCGIEISFSRE